MTTPANPRLYLDDGTGTYSTEVTDYLSMSAGISVSGYGRQDEFSQANAATLSVTLKNDDGRFTDGTVTLEPGTGIRITETVGSTTVNRFTGAVDSIDLGWPGGIGLASTVTVTAVDRLADLSRFNLRSMLEQEILKLSPSAYYTLGEPGGSTSAGDTSGNQAAVLKMVGSGTKVVFGNGTGPVDGLTAAQFAGGRFLRNGSGSSIIPPTTHAFGAAFATTMTPVVSGIIAYSQGWHIAVDSSGHLTVQNPGLLITSSNTYNDGETHTAWAVADGTNVTLIVDGVSVGSSVITTGTFGQDNLAVGAFADGGLTFTGTVSHVAVWDSLTVAEAEALGSFVDDPTESTDDRLTRLAGYAGLTATASTPSGQQMDTQATSGRSLFDALQEVATAEGGVLFVDGSGDIVMQGRYYRGKKTTADASFGSQEPGVDTSVTWDRQQLINQVTVTRTGGATQFVQDGTATYAYPTQLDLSITDDQDALYAAQWVLGKHKDTQPRLASVTFDLMTSPNAEDILGLEIGDRISLSAMPDQLWSTAGDYVVEGWTENRDKDSWTLTCNLLPWELFKVFLLNDTTYGVLDGTNVLGY